VLGGTWDAQLPVVPTGHRRPRRHAAAHTRPWGHSRCFRVAPQHPLAAWPGPIPASELLRHRAIVVADTSQELIARTLGVLEGQDTLRVPDIRAKASAQAAGLGIGHLPRWLAEPEIAAGRLIEKQVAERRPSLPSRRGKSPGLPGPVPAGTEEPRHLAAISRGL
jgi:DNA-binding transcriptional LysR family regulator